MGESRVRFWRQAWWTRPALLMGYALPLGLLGLLLVLGAVGSYRSSHAMRDAEPCPTAGASGCLQQVSGRLDGPLYARGPGSEWRLVDDDGSDAAALDRFRMPTTQSRALGAVGDDLVTGLVWDNEVVAVELADGTRLESDAFGDKAWWTQLLTGLFVVSLAMFLVSAAVGKRRSLGRWWSTSDGRSGAFVPRSRGGFSYALLLVPSMLGLLPIMFSGALTASYVASAVGLALAMLLLALRLFRRAS